MEQYISMDISKLDTEAADLVAAIACQFDSTQDSIKQLRVLASALAHQPQVTGALVAACEEGGPTLSGTRNFSIAGTICPLDILEKVTGSLPDTGNWTDLDHTGIEVPGAYSVLGRKIIAEGEMVALALVGLADSAGVNPLKNQPEWIWQYLGRTAQSALNRHEKLYFEQLRKLELRALTQLEASLSGNLEAQRLQLRRIARDLKEIFASAAVTILIREQGKLYLSATTDVKLAKCEVTYDPGLGLTGHILETGCAINLRNARDLGEMRQWLPDDLVQQRGPASYYPETLAEANGDPFRFLAVPMRSDHEIRGVIRILREEQDFPYSPSEQKALQHFADFLATTLHAAWKLFLSNSIIEAETEAICVTRQEPGKGHEAETIPRVVYVEQGAERLLGLKRDQLENMDGRELYADDDYERVRFCLEQAIREGKRVYGPIKIKTNRFGDSGTDLRFSEISYRMLTSPFVIPETHYTIAVIRDITEDEFQAEQHRRLMALLDKKGLAYFRADENGNTIETTATESKLTGYSLNELRNLSRKHLFYNPPDRHHLIGTVDEREGELVFTNQQLKRKDGSPFWVEGHMHKLKDVEDRKIGYEGLYEDVTDRMMLQELLDTGADTILKKRDLYQQLKENTRFQSLFMASMCHQLRSPLGALLGQLQNFEEGITDTLRFSKRLHYAIGQVKICSLLVANFTYMDKLLRGERFKFRRLNLTKLVIETRIDFEHLAHERKLKITVDSESCDRYFPAVHGHKELIRQVLVNLIDNAIKYSNPHSTIRLVSKEMPGRIYLEIASHGLLVPKEDRKKIFNRGVRIKAAENLVPEGTGLGLWLVKKIVKAHGGEVRCTEISLKDKAHMAFQISLPGRQQIGRRN